MAGYGLVQLLGCLNSETVQALCQHSPWRRENSIIAGQILKGLVMNFRYLNVRAWWSNRCKNFEPPNWRGSEYVEPNTLNTVQTTKMSRSDDENQPEKNRLNGLLRSKL